MDRRRWLAAASVLLAARGLSARSSPAPAQIAREYGRLPLAFTPNHGVTDPRVKFFALGHGYTIFLSRNGAVLRFAAGKRFDASSPGMEGGSPVGALRTVKIGRAAKSARLTTHRLPLAPIALQLTLAGANPIAQIKGVQKLPGRTNYLVGNDPSKWRTNLPAYAKVHYANVYPGIDLDFHGSRSANGSLEFDFVVAPGANPNAITFAIAPLTMRGVKRGQGIESRPSDPKGLEPETNHQPFRMRIDADGDLVIETAEGKIRILKPLAYQDAEAVRNSEGRRARKLRLGEEAPGIPDSKRIPARFVQFKHGKVRFEIGKYDPTKSLVIDPVLSYSTFLGGSDMDYATAIAADGSGNVYVAGYTGSLDFPIAGAVEGQGTGGVCSNALSTSPCFDAFIAKLNATGTALVYSTYLGGSADNEATGIAVDGAGNAYVAGFTDSSDFPAVNAFETSLGAGTCADSSPYPCYDAFAAKLDAAGSALSYSTLLGGSLDDYGTAIAVDKFGNAYVAGLTDSTDLPTTAGAFQQVYQGGNYDGFVVKLGPSGGAPIYATYLGGSGEDHANAIAVDSAGDAFVTGQTNSDNFPAVNAFENSYTGGACGCFDAFVTEVNPTGTGLVYSTYLGGGGGNYGNAIAIDAADEAFVAGWTTSSDFPVTAGAFQTHYSGTYDAFVAKLAAGGGSLVYSTFFGGINPDEAAGIGLDASGEATITGWVDGAGLPSVNAIQSSAGSYYNAFIARFTASGSGLVCATVLGGSGNNFGTAIAVDSAGNADVAGATFSTDLPITPEAFQRIYGGSGYDGFVAQIAPGNAAALAVAPGSLIFPGQAVGTTSTAAVLKLMDAGSAPLDLNGVSVTGDFALTSKTGACGSSLGAGAACAIGVKFTPTTPGLRTGQLQFSDNAAGSPQSVQLSGLATSGDAILSVHSLSFGSVTVGAVSAGQSVTLTNAGPGVLDISSIIATGDFSGANDCASSLAANASCTINVEFAPTADGVSVGGLEINDTAPGSPQSVALSGTGVSPSVSLSPASLSFGDQGVSTASAAQTVTLANTGTGILNISKISVTGNFSETTACPASLASGASCTIGVKFTPLAAGATSGALAITDNAAGSPQSVALSGTGVTAFALAAESPSVTILRGSNTASFTLSASSAYGFTGAIGLACSNAGASSCSFNPLSIAPGASSTLTIQGLSSVGASSVSFTVSGTNGSQTVTLPIEIQFADFTIAAQPGAMTVAAGQIAGATLTLASVNGFSQSVSLACSGEPAQSTCSISPAAVTPTASGAAATLTVTTKASSSVPPFGRRHSAPLGSPWVWVWVPAALAIMGSLSRARRARSFGRGRAARALTLALLAAALAGCGGGGAAPDPKTPGTPAGTYTLTVNATSGTLAHCATITLTVD